MGWDLYSDSSSRRLPGDRGIATLEGVTDWLSGLRAAFFLVLLTAGCTTKEVNWDARRGKFTYAEAVKQYGEPSRVEALPDGGKAGYWMLSDVRTYDFKFQLPQFDGNAEGSLSPGKGDLPQGGRPLGSVGKPVLKLYFGADDQLTDAIRLKDSEPAPTPPPTEPSPAGP